MYRGGSGGRCIGSQLIKNHPASTRGSPTDQISQSMTAVMRSSTANRLPSRKSPCTTAAGRAGGALDPQSGGDLAPPRHQRGIDGLQRAAPSLDLGGRPDHRLGRQAHGAGLNAVQPRHRGRGVPKALRHNGFRSAVGVVEQRLAGAPVDMRHHEQRRHVGRIARVVEEHLRNRHRRRRQRPDDPGLPQDVAVRDRLNSRAARP